MNDSATEAFLSTIPEVPLEVLPSRGDVDAVRRVDDQLDRLDELAQLLAAEDDYVIAPPDYAVPPTFRLSIVIPVYNEEATIRRILARVRAIPFRKEVIVVDDCSTDGTRGVLEQLERSPEFVVFYKPKNEGKGAALRTGFSLATGDVVVVQDADLEYDPRDIPALVQPLVEDIADVAYGSRFMTEEPTDRSLVHRFGNAVLTQASNLFTGLHITDMETCYKAIRRSLLQTIRLKQDRFGFEPEITAKLARRRCRFQEVPISYAPRSWAEGKKIGVKDLFNALWCIVRYGVAE